jgi:dihydrofolate reductase
MSSGASRSAQRITSDMTMSLDGYVAGPNDGVDNSLGDGGERLHIWQYQASSWREPQGLRGGADNRDSEIIEEASRSVGAFVMGRRMFDHGEEPWGDEPPFRRPVFVVTHRPRAALTKVGGTTFTFITDGIEAAVDQARAAAGGLDVAVSGGADIVRQCISSGLLDELQLHLRPIFLGSGVRLFEGMPPGVEATGLRVEGSPIVAHLKYRFGS